MKFSVVTVLAFAMTGSMFAQSAPATAKPKPATSKAKAAPGSAKSTPAPSEPKAEPPSSQAQDTSAGDRVVITVGDETVTASEFERIINTLPENARAQMAGPMKRQTAEQIVRIKLLAAEARKRGLDKNDDVRTRIQLQTENMLAGAAYSELAKTAQIDEAALRKAYEARKNEFETVQAHHILIRFKGSPVELRAGQEELTEEQALAKAQEIRKKLVAGAHFAALAKAESDDVGSGAAGGDLGNFGRGQMVGPFEEVAFKLAPGELSEPIKTQFGWHIIRVDKRAAKTFQDARSQLENELRPQTARNMVEQMRTTASVKLDDAYFGPAPSAVPPAIGTGQSSGQTTGGGTTAQPPAPAPPPAPSATK